MYTKKELVIGILVILLFAGVIIGLPQIESLISGRKNYKYKEVEENVRVIDKYVCNKSIKEVEYHSILEITFYIEKAKVSRIYKQESKTFESKGAFNEAKSKLEENVKTDDLKITNTVDDTNLTIIYARGENIKEGSKVEYPLEEKELVKYLDHEKYVCTKRYKR